MQQVKLVNGKFVAEEVKDNPGNSHKGRRMRYNYPKEQFDTLLMIARNDGLDIDAENERGRIIKENNAVATITNLVLEDFLAKRFTDGLIANKEREAKRKAAAGAAK